MFGLGMGELVVVFMIILLLFGAKKLPEMAEAMGKSMREFKKASNETPDHSEHIPSKKTEKDAGV